MAFLRSVKRKSSSDSELIEKFRHSHDNAYVGELFERYTHLVFGVCLKYLKNEEAAKDAVMEIFEKVLTDLKKHNVENFKSWIYSVAKNHCLMKLRKDKSTRTKKEDYQKFTETIMEKEDFLHLNNGEVQEEKDKILYAGINSLKEEQKKCIELFYMKEKSYEEIAEQTGYSMKQVKSYLQNCKRNLKLYMERNG